MQEMCRTIDTVGFIATTVIDIMSYDSRHGPKASSGDWRIATNPSTRALILSNQHWSITLACTKRRLPAVERSIRVVPVPRA
jgi:hypothetical protein